MSTQVQHSMVNGATPKKPSMPRAPMKKPNAARSTAGGAARPAQQRAAPKAYSVAGESPANGVGSAYSIMAQRIANRVAEMAESITFVERPKSSGQPMPAAEPEDKRKPRKLEMRFGSGGAGQDHVKFSAPFLDNTLQKMLQLQNRMLRTTGELSKSEGVDEKVIKEHAAQSAELSRIIAMICAEKARQE